MSYLMQGKTVVLGVTGGIAAYKAAEIASSLKKMHADVHVVMSQNATEFIQPLTFSSITGNRVVVGMFETVNEWEIKHISLAQKADIVIIAPATANIIGKIANGIADDFLSTMVMATKAPIVIAPAMNTNMYNNTFMQNNIKRLTEAGYHIMQPDSGVLACGDSGVGRLPEPKRIIDFASRILDEETTGLSIEYAKKDTLIVYTDLIPLQGKKVLVTAGPTHENIDPVRYISNRSSGKMGFAIAEALANKGAEVTIVAGPTSIDFEKEYGENERVQIVSVTSAEEMLCEVSERYDEQDMLFFLAAVADYRCKEPANQKIKKEKSAEPQQNNEMVLELCENPDIAYLMGQRKAGINNVDQEKHKKFHFGACAETENVETNAKHKLKAKNFNMIMANNVACEGAGFDVNTNIVDVYTDKDEKYSYPIMTKNQLAERLVDLCIKYMEEK